MSDSKRYYWIKLKERFFKDDIFEYILGLSNGASFVLIFQTLLMETANNNGLLCSKIGNMVVPWDMEKIRIRCRYFPIDTIRVALDIFRKVGWMFETPDGILKIVDFESYVGSETRGAERMRDYRARQNEYEKNQTYEESASPEEPEEIIVNDNPLESQENVVTSNADPVNPATMEDIPAEDPQCKDVALYDNKTLCTKITNRLEVCKKDEEVNDDFSKWLLRLCNRVCDIKYFKSRENVRTSSNTFLRSTLDLLVKNSMVFPSIKKFAEGRCKDYTEASKIALVFSLIGVQLDDLKSKRSFKNG